MRKISIALVTVACTVGLVSSTAAITFPTLTTIYIGAGVRDDGGGPNVGIATVFLCSNVSGANASVRFLVLSESGAVADQETIGIQHGRTVLASTHSTATYLENVPFTTGVVQNGTGEHRVRSVGVFCTAFLLNAASNAEGVPLHLVRVNPHPGTVE